MATKKCSFGFRKKNPLAGGENLRAFRRKTSEILADEQERAANLTAIVAGSPSADAYEGKKAEIFDCLMLFFVFERATLFFILEK